MYLYHRFFMLLPASIHTTIARQVELIDDMNLTRVKSAQITRTSLEINKTISDLFQGSRRALLFFKSWRRRRSLSGYPVIVSSLCVSLFIFLYLLE